MFLYGEGDFKNQEDQGLLARMCNTPPDRNQKNLLENSGVYQVKPNMRILYNPLFYFYIIYMNKIHMRGHVQE